MVGMADPGHFRSLVMQNGLVVPPLIHSGVGECKGCDPYGQLLCGMLQVPGAVQTLHTHSMAAHGRSTGVYNTPVITYSGWASIYITVWYKLLVMVN